MITIKNTLAIKGSRPKCRGNKSSIFRSVEDEVFIFNNVVFYFSTRHYNAILAEGGDSRNHGIGPLNGINLTIG